MHDWTLRSISVDWFASEIKIDFLDASSTHRVIIATGFTLLVIPQKNLWGKSRSVSEVKQVSSAVEGPSRLSIEMQSGDIIEVEASSITSM